MDNFCLLMAKLEIVSWSLASPIYSGRQYVSRYPCLGPGDAEPGATTLAGAPSSQEGVTREATPEVNGHRETCSYPSHF